MSEDESLFRNSMFFALGAASLCLPAHAKAEAAPTVLSRAEPWRLDYDSNACHLIGKFGRSDNEIIVRMSKYDVGQSFTLALIGKPLEFKEWPVRAKLDFGVSGGRREVLMQVGMLAGLPALQASTWFGLRSIESEPNWSIERFNMEARKLQAEKASFGSNEAVRRLTIELPRKTPIQLELGAISQPLARMDACLDDLVRSWGFDPNTVRTQSRAPEPATLPTSWIRPSDYPQLGLTRGQSAVIRFRLNVTDEGKVESCSLLQPGNPQYFEKAVCTSMKKKARFAPALDKEGNPIRSFWSTAVVFMIPR